MAKVGLSGLKKPQAPITPFASAALAANSSGGRLPTTPTQAVQNSPAGQAWLAGQKGTAPVGAAARQDAQAAPGAKSAKDALIPATSIGATPMISAARGIKPVVPAAAAAPGPDDYWKKAQEEYDAIMADDANAWQNQQHTLQGEMAGFQRQADSMNARMGGGIGGGSAGLAGAALGQGMSAYNAAAQEYSNRRRQTQLAWLDQQISHGQHLEDQAFATNTAAIQAAGENPATLRAQDYYKKRIVGNPQATQLYNQWAASGFIDADLEAQLAGSLGVDPYALERSQKQDAEKDAEKASQQADVEKARRTLAHMFRG